mgnify:FL=1|tara:strand:+ start:108 stop:284 length:177 start_codon:yes stop_codon:yes gene_type:complete
MTESEQMVEDAYSDPKMLEHLYRNHMLLHDRAMKRILKEHFERLNRQKEKLCHCTQSK